jgi:transcriptional regulator with XRE-family HTH domain
MSLGGNIRRLRKDRGLSQIQLAEASGIKVAHISRLESDSSDPKISTIYKLMEALNCSPDALLMDSKKVGIDSILKSTLERAINLPEVNKRVIVDIVDKYCIACGMEMALSEQNTNWLKKFIYGEAPESPLQKETTSG